MAKLGGVPTAAAVELRTQNFYFAFQVVQVFLVVTLTSSAASVVEKILLQPQLAANMLAQNLPKASNFYISYIVLQGLSFSSGALLQITGLILGKVLGLLLDNTPRKMYNRWASLSGLGWGTVFPSLTLLAVIGGFQPVTIDSDDGSADSIHYSSSDHLLLHRAAGSRIRDHWPVSLLLRLPIQPAVRLER